MKRFTFRLETLLRHRRNLEEKERDELFRLMSLLHQKRTQLQGIQERNQATLLELKRKRMEDAEHIEIDLFYRYLNRLGHEMAQCRKNISQLEQQIENQKVIVIEASKRKKILDTLKSRNEKEYHTLVEKEEQKAVDEMVVIRFPQKSR